MGAVYRAIYTQTGKRVALKVMLPGMGESESARKRFEREAAILKQFSHPNIVRYLGTGKNKGIRWCAMEYVEGETLDRKLTRQGRLTWEEVVNLGRQLCSALQHAHAQGVVHRDLKPSNLMILKDGTLKLADFGIAKDLDVTQLTEANCTVGTASYMSPEQCKGEKNLSHKSDLYSLGIVFYELLTGNKPFVAENVMDMFMAHVQGTFERPSRRVVDIPKGLDVLVCQLMEKKPEQRPFDADTVYNALGAVVEKVEARQSAGLDAARSRAVDRRRGEARPDEQDREAARTLLTGGKKKRKKKTAHVPFYRQLAFQAAGIVCLLAATAFAIYLVLRPPSAEKLYGRIEKLMAKDDEEARRAAFQGPIREYLRRYGALDDDNTRRVRDWDTRIGVEVAERELADLKQKVKKIDVSKMDALTEAARKALIAAQAEDDGDFERATRAWQEIAREHRDDEPYFAELARRRVEVQYAEMGQRLKGLDRHFHEIKEFGREPQIASETERRAFTALRYERFGDLFEAHRRWSSLREDLETRPQERAWFLAAGSKARAFKGRPTDVKDETEARLAVLRRNLAEAKKQSATSVLRTRAICLDVLALYGRSPEKEFREPVEAARKLLKEVDPGAQIE